VSTNPTPLSTPFPQPPLTAAGAERPMEKPTVQEEIRKGIKALYRTGDVVEVRAFHPAGPPSVGRYTVGWELVRAIEKADKEGNDVYYCLNPTSLPPIPLATGQSGTKEGDVPRRRHFLLDFDPIRTHKIASDAQHAAALKQATLARDFMEAKWAVRPTMASSGNGVHLLVPVSLPNDEPSKEIIRRAQRVIATKFNTDAVECECFPDAARITRAYATLNKKSKETAELKWRRSGLLGEGAAGVVTLEQLQKFVADYEVPEGSPKATGPSTVPGSDTGPYTIEKVDEYMGLLADANPGFKSEKCRTSKGPGHRVPCPGNTERGWPDGTRHSEIGGDLNGSCAVFLENGWLRFSCRHAHCSEGAATGKKTMKHFVEVYDPGGLMQRRVLTGVGPFTDPAATENFRAEAGKAASQEVVDSLPFFSDQALSEFFTQINKDQIAYLDRDKWATFGNGIWTEDPNDLAASYRAGQFLMGQILSQVDARIKDDKKAASTLKSRLCSAQTQRNVISLAKQRPTIFHKSEEFDREEFLIGAPKGQLVDLRTGEVRAATAQDFLMKAVSCVPSNAPCPRWEKFIDEITDGDRGLRSYLQRMLGSWLTASVRDQVLAVFHGHGGNGKGTLIAVIQHILGKYSRTIPVDSLVTKKSGDTDLTGVAMLCGARLAVAQEGETTRRFNAGLIKTLTGGDELTGRLLYENKFSFKPTHKLVILTNNKPRIDLDGGIKRRLHLVPFTRSFEGAAKNVHLKEELLTEAPGILSWMIEGCLAWQQRGLEAPSSVVDYTNEYFEEADDLKSWIEQNCVRDPNRWTSAVDLFSDWRMFCKEGRAFAGTQKDFVEHLVREGFQKKRNRKGDKRGVVGLSIRNPGMRVN